MNYDSAMEAELSPRIIETSSEYVGRWNLLVSTTNWEKGRIIFQWRQALQQSGAPLVSFTDEAWAQSVGGVTPQHVGRLRRVYERFADSYEQYPKLYWSHFLSALDWPDAEMWLEGATQNGWSISEMRDRRWETLGGVPELKPKDSDIAMAEAEADEAPFDDDRVPEAVAETLGEVHDTAVGNRRSADANENDEEPAENESPAMEAASAAPFRPFENLAPMPSDLNEAFELFKLAIINHKLSGWRQIGSDDVIDVLESLKKLTLAPAE
jgi:hypothetical protein